MKRIGILGHGFVTWEGGIDFLRLIIGSLQANLGADVAQFHLLLPIEDERLLLCPQPSLTDQWLRKFTKTAPRPPLPPPPNLGLDKVRAALDEFWPTLKVHRVGHHVNAIEAAYKALRLDVVLPAMDPLTTDRSINWVGYIYDMQHVHFPHFFSAQEIASRSAHFESMLNHERALIVNSESVRQDISTHVKNSRGTVFALPFGASPHPRWLEADLDVRNEYGINGSYFCICNQFWKHKDHATAFLGFAQVMHEYPDVNLVCTGHQSDYRDPSYFEQLQRLIAESGLTSRIHLTGSIPKAHQISLMKHAEALIQPTLFEGGPGGGAVFDAVSLGVPAIVSDIPVNREISENLVSYFKAGNPESLRDELRRQLCKPRHSQLDKQVLLALGRQRRQRCGETLVQAMRFSALL